MTIKELREHCIRQITEFERIKEIMPVTPNGYKRYEEHKIVLQLIEAWEKLREEIVESTIDNDLDLGYEMYYNKAIHDVLNIFDEHLAKLEAGDDRRDNR